MRDTQAVGLVALNPNVLVVPADSPWRTPQQLFEAAQAKPDTITIGSPGIGTVPHLVSLLIGQELNVRVVPVPYKGSARAHARPGQRPGQRGDGQSVRASGL
ncbi:tripartite tricarboxylate transporter substrate-binding protein [Bordetella pertussis]|uniref:tripartite tricarboxylate transporter substrate-binding protein n=1 Tax=Bordetella pertussis TaxID=520 RepID=UPI00202B737E|nr:tripartite tricarboxylate transporter substrate-binding protein [Bordetella pertussis]